MKKIYSIFNLLAVSIFFRFKHILQIVEQCGELDRIIEGLFENYLNINFKDSKMDLVRRILIFFLN